MAKKHWIYIKRGLSEDPKHRERMGNRIWLFLHIIDRADWESGIVHDWKDKQEADDMGISWRTLQRQRQELEDLGYITASQNSNHQEIIIHNWINPRNYSGDVLNRGGDYAKMSTGGTHQGTHQGTQTSYSDLRTPPLDSKVIDQGPVRAPKPARPRDPLFDAIAEVCQVDITIRANAQSVGTVRAALISASPPYTAEEVCAWGARQAWRHTPPTVWQLRGEIGAIRGNGSGHEPTGMDAIRAYGIEKGFIDG